MDFFYCKVQYINIYRMDYYTAEELKITYPSREVKEQQSEEFDKIVNKNVIERFRCSTLLNYRPASKQQIQEWSTWITSSGLKKVNDEEESIKQKWSSEKWNPFVEERKIANMFDHARNGYMRTTRYKAYLLFGKEQYDLLDVYNKTQLEEDLYNLYLHIWKHGKIIQQTLPNPPIISKKEEEED